MAMDGIVFADQIDPDAVARVLRRMAIVPSREITWPYLVQLEPRLTDLYRQAEARAGTNDLDHIWYGRTGIKRRLRALVGHEAEGSDAHPDLYTARAYDVAYQTLLAVVEA